MAKRTGFAVVVLLCLCALTPPMAGAISANIHIHGTGGQGVYLRPAPDTSQPGLRLIPEGASPDYNCFTYGQNINRVKVWFNVNRSGATGFYASYYDDSSYHSETELTSKYGIPKCGAAPPPTPSPSPSPSPTITASVGGQYGCGACHGLNIAVNNFPTGTYTYECHDNSGAGGSDLMFFSHTVSVTDPNQSSWPGVFCYDSPPYVAYVVMNGVRSNSVQFGDSGSPGPVDTGPGDSGPSDGGLEPVTPGPVAGGSSPQPAGGGPVSDGNPGGSMFFLPKDNHLSTVADTTVEYDDWRGSNCALKHALPVPPTRLPVTLGGWSNGRLGPIYYLNAASDAQRSVVKYVLLIDPGGTKQFKSSCDATVHPSDVLSRWLALDPAKNAKLVIIAATITNDDGRKGLYQYYLKSLSKAQRKNQVLVCTEGNTSHRTAFNRYAAPGGSQTAFLRNQKFRCPYGVDTVPPGD